MTHNSYGGLINISSLNLIEKMPPRKSNRRFNNNLPIPLPPPPSQYDPTVFQAAVTAAMTQINASDSSGAGSGAYNSNHGESL